MTATTKPEFAPVHNVQHHVIVPTKVNHVSVVVVLPPTHESTAVVNPDANQAKAAKIQTAT